MSLFERKIAKQKKEAAKEETDLLNSPFIPVNQGIKGNGDSTEPQQLVASESTICYLLVEINNRLSIIITGIETNIETNKKVLEQLEMLTAEVKDA